MRFRHHTIRGPQVTFRALTSALLGDAEVQSMAGMKRPSTGTTSRPWRSRRLAAMASPIAGRAVDPDRPGRQIVHSLVQLVKRDVQSVVEMCLIPFVLATDIERYLGRVHHCLGQVTESPDGIRAPR